MSGPIPPIFNFARPVEAVAGRGVAGGLVAARVREPVADRVILSEPSRAAIATPTGGTLSLFRTPADRMEAATGVARGRLVDRRA